MVTQTNSEKRPILHRVEKWPLTLTEVLQTLLVRVSDGLREYYNWALEQQQANYQSYTEAKEKDSKQKEVKGFLTAFDLYGQYKSLRKEDQVASLQRGFIPANWVLESSLQEPTSAYKSFFTLVKRGDSDAHPPKPATGERFKVISGALPKNFGIKEDGMIQMVPTMFDGAMCFDVPTHQIECMKRAVRFAKFTISRDRHGTFFMSIAYEIEQPELVEFIPENAVYLALGASSIGVVSPYGEGVIDFWRPDKYWKPKIDAHHATTKSLLETGQLKKGSRSHERRKEEARLMFEKLSLQQKNHQREVASSLIRRVCEQPLNKRERRFARRHNKLPLNAKMLTSGHGVHFVITELVVRSKKGKLADADKPERGGPLGANWAAQNTGSLARFVQDLKNKVEEAGGSIRRLPVDVHLDDSLPENEKKIAVAKQLREQFLKDPDKAMVL